MLYFNEILGRYMHKTIKLRSRLVISEFAGLMLFMIIDEDYITY